jgi:hypothetical protein
LPCTYDIPIWIHRAVILSRGSCRSAGAVRRTRSGRLEPAFPWPSLESKKIAWSGPSDITME